MRISEKNGKNKHRAFNQIESYPLFIYNEFPGEVHTEIPQIRSCKISFKKKSKVYLLSIRSEIQTN